MKISTKNDNNFGYEKITIVVDNIPLNIYVFIIITGSIPPLVEYLTVIANYPLNRIVLLE